MKKSLISLTPIFLVQIILLPIIHGRIIFPMNAALVDQTCKQTPNFDLCETLLRSDPRSLNAEDAKGLASIMVDIVQAKATKSMDKINGLLKSPGENQALFTSCIDNYNTIIDDDIPQASEAFSNDDNITAEDRLKDVTFEVDLCDKQFSGPSNPLKDVNKDVHDAASIAAAIADKLP
ncbi:cell wall / vacuolar inhibitor of fructosidase 1-like [Pyrus ussuriensis x Pyrus communis]|uniref:Cell wall / vacuolar inhibitor of fructosidase 1-like n=2 Tax=Pyrus TaxID=3766 RepID=A0A5N5FDP0_9ROSA|nr:cell wall / vacuolar inhibitor of fructosidase 1-like [Pyrus ussuriensis x Pyrus communis]